MDIAMCSTIPWQCEAVEFFIDKAVKIIINNEFIVSKDFNLLKNYINDIKEDNGVYISKSSSMGISLSEGKIESILFAEKNYY